MSKRLFRRFIEKDFKPYKIESFLENNNLSDKFQSVIFRRHWYQKNNKAFRNIESGIPYKDYNYSQIYRSNCENVIGYIPVPLGIVGPLKINGHLYNIPLATTEGGLIGSLNRGSKAIYNNNKDYGIRTLVIDKGITRAPIIECESLSKVRELVDWFNKENNINHLKFIFEKTSRFGKLQDVSIHHAGTKIHLRLRALTGDAMGMNIISKGSDAIVQELQSKFGVKILSLSGNCCTDKKPSAINWVKGRGKTVIAETFLPNIVLKNILHVPNPESLVKLNIEKNFVGSALAGSIGGFNAHVANTLAAIFLATGQDLAQIGTSSVGITQYEIHEGGLKISLTMPSLELGTIGGGTNLNAQSACLEILGIDNKLEPGKNVEKLAEIVTSTALAGEISLMSALVSGDLVQAHMQLNRAPNKTIQNID